jgi:hypothetical protein
VSRVDARRIAVGDAEGGLSLYVPSRISMPPRSLDPWQSAASSAVRCARRVASPVGWHCRRWDIDSCSRLRDGPISGDTTAVTSLCVGLSLGHRDYHTGDPGLPQPKPTFLLYAARAPLPLASAALGCLPSSPAAAVPCRCDVRWAYVSARWHDATRRGRYVGQASGNITTVDVHSGDALAVLTPTTPSPVVACMLIDAEGGRVKPPAMPRRLQRCGSLVSVASEPSAVGEPGLNLAKSSDSLKVPRNPAQSTALRASAACTAALRLYRPAARAVQSTRIAFRCV